jgi:2',3'-cyclic-nucleotide 2'-phosphodiesterase (5'-nucleotidase family)
VDIAALAANLQRGVDEITAAGINKVILLSHMQQISVEIELAKRLRNVDIIIAGGSNTRLGNSRMRPGEVSQGPYPRIEQSPTNPVAILNVDGDYKYLGRFIAPFDASGRLMDWLIDSRSDAYGTSAVDTAGGVTPITEVVSLREQSFRPRMVMFSERQRCTLMAGGLRYAPKRQTLATLPLMQTYGTPSSLIHQHRSH